MRGSWSSFPTLGFVCAATAGRDEQRAGREKLSWFPAGKGKCNRCSHFPDVVSEPVTCQQVCTSLQVLPCTHCWTSVTSTFPAGNFQPFSHFRLALGHISHRDKSHSGPALTEVMKSLSQLCWDWVLEGKANIWSAASTQLMAQGVLSSSSTTSSFLILLKASRVSFWRAERR